MKRRILCFVLTMAMVLSMLVIVPAVTASAEEDTYNASDNPVIITTLDDLRAFRDAVNSGTTFSGKTIQLMNDFSVGDWTPICSSNGKTFSGTFDGNGHTITMAQVWGSNRDGNAGFFGDITTGGAAVVIKNLHIAGTLTNSKILEWVGGIVSNVRGGGSLTIQNCWSSIDIICTGSAQRMKGVGGIFGCISGNANAGTITVKIDSCVYSGEIRTGTDASNVIWVGGIMGGTAANNSQKTVVVSNCLVTGLINIRSTSQIGGASYIDSNGGIVGFFKSTEGSSDVNATLRDCVFAGVIKFNDKSSATDHGIILGETSTNSYMTIRVYNCYYRTKADGAVEGNSATFNAVGYHNGKISSADLATLVGKTRAQLKALTSSTAAFTDNSKWNFGTSSDIPIPASVYSLFQIGIAGTVGWSNLTISTADQLLQLASAVNSFSTTFSATTVTLGADIDLTDYSWPSIGSRNNGNGASAFSGIFDGANHIVKIASLTGAQSEGGLFGYTKGATIRNLYLTGTIDLDKSKGDLQVGYFGSVIGCVGPGTTTVSNVLSDVRIYCNARWFQYSGGFIGGLENNVTAGIDCTDCVFAGRIYANASIQESGGFFGYTGNNDSTSYTKTVSFTRCMFTGQFVVNTSDGYIDDNSPFIGYLRHNSSNQGYLNVTLTDCVMAGKVTFGSLASTLTVAMDDFCAFVGWAGKYNANATYSTANNYYVSFKLPDGNAALAKGGDGTVNATAKTASAMGGLTASDFSGGSTYWSFSSGYIPCPTAIVNAFGWTSTFEVPAITIATKDAFLAFRDAVNGGKSYSGEVLKLTADIDLAGESWQEIGRAASTSSVGSNVFKGTFNGDGHTISNMTTVLEPTSGFVDMQGGLFGNLGDGAVVKNFTLTGSMSITNKSSASGSSAYFGSIANAVSGTVLIQNVYSSVNITTANAKNPDTGNWAGGVTYAAGLVGFALHNSTTTLTIDGCEYVGTINCANGAEGTAGIMAHSGNGGTKVFNITNTTFSGRVTLNDNGSKSAYANCGGIFGRLASGTLNISNTHSGGDHFYFNRSKAWTATDITAGQIIGQVVSGATANVDSSVSYSPIVLFTEVSGGSPVESSKFVLGEIGYDGNTSTYTVDTDAHLDGFASDATARNVNDDYKGIRFSATIFNTASCTDGGTQAANFGVFLMTKDIYDLFRGNLTYANLNAAATALDNVVKVMGLKYKDNGESYTVYAVVYNLNTSARKATELVAVPYLGTRIGEATVATYNSVFG